MKYLLSFFVSSFILISSGYAQEQQIPNSNFEEWDSEHYATGWNAYEIDVLFSTFYTAQRTTDAAFGQYAVKLETQDLVMEYLPGVILLGEVDFETFMPYGGIPFSDRPTGMRFSYKYSPSGDDQAVAICLLTKWNETNQSADTVGGGFFFVEEEQTSYFRKTFPIYYQTIEAPDTINIGFVSSFEDPQPGSVLYVDSVEMVYDLVNYPTICAPAYDISSLGFSATWAPIPHALAYSLEVAEDPQFSQLLASYPVQIPNSYSPYHEVSVSQIGQYFFRVKVLYAGDESEYSNTISVPLPTYAMEADNITSSGFRANWQPVTEADEFLLDVAQDQNFTNMLAGYSAYSAGTNTSHTVSGLSVGSEYFYRLKTVYGNDTSVYSGNVNVITNPLGMNNLTEKDVKLNPVSGGLRIELSPESLPASVKIYDIGGREIVHSQQQTSAKAYYFDEKGLYIVKVISKKGVLSRKIIF